MGIGSKLDKLIKEKGRNVNDVARAAQVPSSTVYSIIKRDNTKADLDDLQRLAKELGVTLEYFVDDEGIENPSYYLDPEAAEIAQEVYDRPELKLLFDASRKVSSEDLKFVIDMVDRLKKNEGK